LVSGQKKRYPREKAYSSKPQRWTHFATKAQWEIKRAFWVETGPVGKKKRQSGLASKIVGEAMNVQNPATTSKEKITKKKDSQKEGGPKAEAFAVRGRTAKK